MRGGAPGLPFTRRAAVDQRLSLVLQCYEVRLAERRHFLGVPYWHRLNVLVFGEDNAQAIAADWLMGGDTVFDLRRSYFAGLPA